MKKVYPEKNRRGFSLYELLIVMAIIGILAAVTVFSLSSFLPSWQMSGTSRLLTNKLRQAQEEAVTTQKQHKIYFKSLATPVTYQLIKIDGGDILLEEYQMSNNITVALEPNNVGDKVTFSADGGLSSGGNINKITLTLGGATKTIDISAAGVIKLQ